MTKVLITGAAGSGASFLAENLIEHDRGEVFGLVRWHSTSSMKNLEKVAGKIEVVECDMTDLSSLVRTLQKIRPKHIYNVASHANVKVCFDNPISVFQNNVNATLNLFEAIRITGIDCIVQQTSTSEVYGNPEKTPIKEDFPLLPRNIYSVSKLTQEKIAMTYFYGYKIPVIITRTFAYLNERRGDIFSSAFARQVAEIEKGKKKILTHGNLNSVRTLIDVRDVAEAYCIAMEKCNYGEPYNIGGLKAITVKDFLETLKNLSTSKIETKLDENLLRPTDCTLQVPDCTKFVEKTGWKPKISLEQSIQNLLHYYRNNV